MARAALCAGLQLAGIERSESTLVNQNRTHANEVSKADRDSSAPTLSAGICPGLQRHGDGVNRSFSEVHCQPGNREIDGRKSH